MAETLTLLDDLCFGEGPRWHEDQLWFSDMHDHKVIRVGLDGRAATVVEFPGRPSGIGWLPDGSMLVVSMLDKKLLRLDGEKLVEFADLDGLASHQCNDMVTAANGRSYVGNFGYDMMGGADFDTAELVMVDPEGNARIVADELSFPNGTVITADEKTLIVGETMAARLTAFDIATDGSLANRRVWAQLEGAVPDGICLDEDGGIWVASPISNEVLRVVEGGEVTDRVAVDTQAFACMLGGKEGKTLFILTANSSDPAECVASRSGKVEMVEVQAARAGTP